MLGRTAQTLFLPNELNKPVKRVERSIKGPWYRGVRGRRKLVECQMLPKIPCLLYESLATQVSLAFPLSCWNLCEAFLFAPVGVFPRSRLLPKGSMVSGTTNGKG
jgi:hypothetical protein